MATLSSRGAAVAVTVDVYDTLVRYDGAATFFEELLAPQLGRAQSAAFRRRDDEGLVAAFRHLASLDFGVTPFFTIKDLYRRVFESLCPDFGVELCAGEAAAALAEVVGRMPLFPETREFLGRLRRRYPHYIVSDIDDDILRTVFAHHGLTFEYVVTSESARCYKCSLGSDLFQRASAELGVPVGRLVHTGDWLPDVVGAQAAGAKAIRVRRNGSAFDDGGPAPDAECADLLAALDLVETLL